MGNIDTAGADLRLFYSGNMFYTTNRQTRILSGYLINDGSFRNNVI